jgi:LEA14-like dessication related protein
MKTILAAIGVFSIIGLAAYQAILAIIANIKVVPGNPSLDSQFFADGFIQTSVPITIENNNPFPLAIVNFFGVVNYGQLRLANVALPVGFYVPANSVKTIILDLDIPVESVVQDTVLLIQQGDVWNALLNRVELTGSIALGGGGHSFSIPLNRVAIPIV